MRAWLLLAVLYLVSVLAAYVAGLNNGQASTQRDNARADLQAVERVLQRSQAQTEQANKTSQDLLVQMQNRVRQDQKTTQELRNALAQTADSRAECRIPAELMHYLDQAHAAAAQATTRRLDAAVPSASAASQ